MAPWRSLFFFSFDQQFLSLSRVLSTGPRGGLRDLQLGGSRAVVQSAVLRTSDLSLDEENEFPTCSGRSFPLHARVQVTRDFRARNARVVGPKTRWHPNEIGVTNEKLSNTGPREFRRNLYFPRDTAAPAESRYFTVRSDAPRLAIGNCRFCGSRSKLARVVSNGGSNECTKRDNRDYEFVTSNNLRQSVHVAIRVHILALEILIMS